MAEENTSQRQEKKGKGKLIGIIAGAVVVIAAIVVTLILVLGNKNPLIGKWLYEDGGWFYEFTDDTNGTYGYEGFGEGNKFTYKTEDGKLKLLYNGATQDFEHKYRLDGNNLYVEDSFGEEVHYVKQ